MSLEIVEPVEFFCESNYYNIDGVKYPRVTRIKDIIKNYGLVNWQISVGKKKSMEIMKKRGEFGTRLHNLIKITLEGKKVNLKNYDEETQITMKIFNDFLEENKVKPELLEQHLWSRGPSETSINRFAGTADFIGYVNDKLMILDWKTSKGIYPDMWLQLSAYVVALEELTGKKVDGCGILQIRDGKKKFEMKTYDEMMFEFNVFKACLVIYNKYFNK